MLISLNWIRDFVDLPEDLDPSDLAERFTRTTAEVEGVTPIRVAARGLVVACVLEVVPLAGTHNLRLATLEVGDGQTIETVTAAPAIHVGSNLIYAPPGASVASLPKIGTTKVADRTSAGMILPGDSIGIAMAAHEAIFLNDMVAPGQELEPELFEDWVIEVDNKSLTHRPDLWGHYGIAREMAAILGVPLKPYPVLPLDEFTSPDLPSVEISIADSEACRRYSGIVVTGAPILSAPLWMQLKLGHVGMRPITGLVDLTNYVMADLGQPMHAFDAAKVDRIDVDWASDGERFKTLDGMERTLTADTLMIKCGGQPIAIAGVMGGLESEVSETTESLLLESANFQPTVIRKTAARLSLRTDASARFEKSLDPVHTVLAIQRFLLLAAPMYQNLKLAGRLCDSYPTPQEPTTVTINPERVNRMMGRTVDADEITRTLEPLGFSVDKIDAELRIVVPSYRATNDISIEVDVIEEIARCIGYDTIEPTMPRVGMRRFELNALHELEQRTLEYFTCCQGFHEIQGYVWDDATWLDQLGVDPGECVELANPAADGLHRLRRSLLPGLLGAIAKNRFHFPALSLIELGSVFAPGEQKDQEWRHVGIVSARRGKGGEDALYGGVKGAIEGWAWERFGRPVEFVEDTPAPNQPWEQPHRTVSVLIDGINAGRVSVIDMALRRRVDEHLAAWAIAWAQLRLTGLEQLDSGSERPGTIPEYPLIETDFSILVPRSTRYGEVIGKLASFEHALLKRIEYIGSYEGDRIESEQRSLTFRAVVGDDTRTLVDEDASAFRKAMERHLLDCGYRIRGG